MKPNEQAAREVAQKQFSADTTTGATMRMICAEVHISGQQHILDTLAEMAREHEKVIEDYLKKNCSNFGLGTSMGNSIRQSAHFGFTLGRASMQGENEKMRERLLDTDFVIDKVGGCESRSYRKKLEDQLTQRDATIVKMQGEIDELKFNLKQKSKEIGRSEHRGNTVDYIYDKCATYGKLFDEQRTEILRLNEMVEVMEKYMDYIMKKSEEIKYETRQIWDQTKAGEHINACALRAWTGIILVKGAFTKISEMRKKL